MKKKYSGKQVEKAGRILASTEDLDYSELSDQMDVLSYWRLFHERPLNEAFEKIQQVVTEFDKEAIFARRLKRYHSIIVKLRRFDSMNLKNMQDIGGCRAIVENEKKLHQVVRKLRRLPEFKNTARSFRAKDYLKHPKEDGYRSYHLIGKFKDEAGDTKSIEVQIRTLIQHYWATALEIVDLFTGQALKSNQGDAEWGTFFRLVGAQFAVMDKVHLFTQLDVDAKQKHYVNEVLKSEEHFAACRQIKRIDKKLDVSTKMNAFAGSLQVIENQLNITENAGFMLLQMDIVNRKVSGTTFKEECAEEAEAAYIETEKKYATSQSNVVALVSTSKIGDIKAAYPNFFADSTQFLLHLDIIETTTSKITNRGFLEALLGAAPKLKR